MSTANAIFKCETNDTYSVVFESSYPYNRVQKGELEWKSNLSFQVKTVRICQCSILEC